MARNAKLDAYEILLHSEFYNHIINKIKRDMDIILRPDPESRYPFDCMGIVPGTDIPFRISIEAGFALRFECYPPGKGDHIFSFGWFNTSQIEITYEPFLKMIKPLSDFADKWYEAFNKERYEECSKLIHDDGGDEYVVRG